MQQEPLAFVQRILEEALNQSFLSEKTIHLAHPAKEHQSHQQIN